MCFGMRSQGMFLVVVLSGNSIDDISCGRYVAIELLTLLVLVLLRFTLFDFQHRVTKGELV